MLRARRFSAASTLNMPRAQYSIAGFAASSSPALSISSAEGMFFAPGIMPYAVLDASRMSIICTSPGVRDANSSCVITTFSAI